ncbi:hypothetical protein [Natronorubrum bangense]|uniref:CbaC protein n=2 Tax=Natronorubrum bangense TaxID=61858 RepID=L9WPS3_9EURY|nr:hypothetical protein [Natronorubrum bangense]ELY51475.1 hypothetical protein C494_04005 [Natronorubrum bangense JCM 10635]QCC54562.1 CbaC protein [Natronorubrum bangense]
MALSRVQLLLVIAFLIVVLVELRTVLGFFGIELSAMAATAIGVVVIGALVLWSLASSGDHSDE